MKKVDLRVMDDPKIWSRLPRKPDDALDYLFNHLIEGNAKLGALGDKEIWGVYDANVRKRVRQAQETLLLLYRFDSEVQNGGFVQFCWNSPEEVKDVRRAIKVLDLPEFGALYQKAAARFADKQKQFFQLWKQFQDSPDRDWTLFQKAYKVLDLEQFDNDYIETHRPKMVRTLVKFILNSKPEFVK